VEQQISRITSLLRQWNLGDAGAREELVSIVYPDLRRLANHHLQRERAGHTLQPTALVHEVYLQLCGQEDSHWVDRAHFFAVAARMMRRILVDYSRQRGAEKRGGNAVRVAFDDAIQLPLDQPVNLIALDDALTELATFDARKCQVVELRFFVGLDAKEIAAVLKTSEATVRKDWMIAKAWLFRQLEGAAEA
jgi:RNA polymerase sigma factor (TIGR02999 family)